MTIRTRLYRWWWRTPLGRALYKELDQAHTDLRGMTAGYETAREEANALERAVLCAGELLAERDAQYAALAARCRRAEESLDLYKRFFAATVPPMPGLDK